ncbi:hypothetical protein [Tautonia marina]|uniref:hypothetical protein n=1 Tax=Tautonia marina TaxID=2653855 RepID=UPI001260E825|nr:hypothetical protein [Tautonia marina]
MIGNRIDLAFSGDLTDPWVAALHEAIRGLSPRILGAELPEDGAAGPTPSVLVLHRGTLSVTEADRLRRLRDSDRAPRVILVVGPHARYHQIMAWSGLVDVVLPEATASETIARHVGQPGPPRSVPPRARPIALACGHWELGRMVEDTLREAGYAPRRARDNPLLGPEPWVVWDVPVLDPDWSTRLATAAQRRGVIALLGLADRETVAKARASGAIACLDLPCDPDDLIFVLDRLTASRRAAAPRRDASHPHRPRSFDRQPRVRTQ